MNSRDEFEFEELGEVDFWHDPTPEEIEQRKKEWAIELERKGFLPENEGYSETMSSPQEAVENNPKRFIIEECIPACQELWKKNIYTFMVSDHLNEGICWIEIKVDSLSDENKCIYLGLPGDETVKFSYHPGAVNFGVNCVGKAGQAKLLELAKKFQMQDVPKDQAYISPEDFLMTYCGCWEEYENPNYRPMKMPWEVGLQLDDLADYIIEYDQWEASPESHKVLKKYAPEKATKPISELVADHGMILEDGRVYLSLFHYKKHQNYLKHVNGRNSDEEITINNGQRAEISSLNGLYYEQLRRR